MSHIIWLILKKLMKDDKICETDSILNNEICVNTAGSYLCNCAPGWNRVGANCIDRDECMTTTCQSNAVCENSIGEYFRFI